MSCSVMNSSFFSLNNDCGAMMEKFKELLRPEDHIIQTVRLEGGHFERQRFLSIICNQNADEYEYCLLGIDCTIKVKQHPNNLNDQKACTEQKEVHASIGLVVKVLWDPELKLDGDGGFSVRQKGQHYIFKPISVQALWKVIQTLHMIVERLTPQRYTYTERQYRNHPGSNNDKNNEEIEDWVEEYEKRILSSQSCLNEWHEMPDLLVKRPRSSEFSDSGELQTTHQKEIAIGSKLRSVMKTVDLDNVTSKAIRTSCEAEMGESLEEFKSFIDKEILLILGQMNPASKILEYLYLGSEWNASNLDELKDNKITHILNVTREIDNFFPSRFQYKNIRVYDEEATDLLRFLDSTYKFIREAKEQRGSVLVHCKMGISRSATVVISYMMKEYEKDLCQTLIDVKEKRSIVNPNQGFIKQLEVYEGMISAIRLTHTYFAPNLHRSKSESSLVQSSNSDQLSNDAESSYNAARLAQEEMFKSVDVKAMKLAFSNPQRMLNPNVDISSELSNFSISRTTSDNHIRSDRPKSWSPNETLANILFPTDISPNKRRHTNSSDILTCDSRFTTVIVSEGTNEKSFTLETPNINLEKDLIETSTKADCTCFNDLSENLDEEGTTTIASNETLHTSEDMNAESVSSELCSKDIKTDLSKVDPSDQQYNSVTTPTKYQKITLTRALPSPVNSSNNAYDPNCDCNVEVELSVPEEPVKIHDTLPDKCTDSIVQKLANVPLQIRSSPLIEKQQVRFSQQINDYPNQQTKLKDYDTDRKFKSFSHSPVINSNVSNLISHYFPTPYFSNVTSNSNAKTNKPKKAFNASINSSTSSLTSLMSTSSSSPATPTTLNSPSGVLRRSSAAGDFSMSSSLCQQKRSVKRENRISASIRRLSKSSGQRLMSTSLPTSLPANTNEKFEHNSSMQGIRSGIVEELISSVFMSEKPLVEEDESMKINLAKEHLLKEKLYGSGDDNQNLEVDRNSKKCDNFEINSGVRDKNDELSVKTLANLFDFKIDKAVPTYKPYSTLEENRLFLKGKLDGEELANAKTCKIQLSESEC